MTSDPFNIKQHNSAVSRTGYRIRVQLKQSISRLSMKGKADLMRSLRLRFKYEFGEISQLKYQFSRHGIFFHKGVGRGYIMQGGRVVKGSKKNPMFKPIERTGKSRTPRRPKEWFNPVMDREVPKLADLIAKYRADGAAKSIIKIK